MMYNLEKVVDIKNPYGMVVLTAGVCISGRGLIQQPTAFHAMKDNKG